MKSAHGNIFAGTNLKTDQGCGQLGSRPVFKGRGQPGVHRNE